MNRGFQGRFNLKITHFPLSKGGYGEEEREEREKGRREREMKMKIIKIFHNSLSKGGERAER